MKFCIIVLTLVFAYSNAVPTEKRKAELTAMISNCAKETKASDKDLEDFHAGKLQADKVPETVKCFIKCFMEQVGLIDTKSGEFSADNLKKRFAKYITDANRKELDEALVKCSAIKGTSPCDTAFKISSCMAVVKMQVDD